MYFEILELLVGAIDKRFDQQSMEVPRSIETSTSLLEAGNADDAATVTPGPVVPQAVSDLYSKDIDTKRLERQMRMLPDLLRTCPDPVKKVTKVRTLANMIAATLLASSMFSEVDNCKLVRVYLTFNTSDHDDWGKIILCSAAHQDLSPFFHDPATRCIQTW